MVRKILFTLFLFSTMNLIAQKQEFIGIGISSEMMNSANMQTGIAFSYENQLSKHNGFEIEVNHRSKDQYLTASIEDGTYHSSHIKEDYLTLPILYKFYSNIINVSTGVTFDYFVGWKDLTKLGGVELTSYSINPRIYVGWAFKVGKTIKLSPRFILEPEIQFNPIFDYGYSYYGTAVKLKYKL